eukprot:337953_1
MRGEMSTPIIEIACVDIDYVTIKYETGASLSEIYQIKIEYIEDRDDDDNNQQSTWISTQHHIEGGEITIKSLKPGCGYKIRAAACDFPRSSNKTRPWSNYSHIHVFTTKKISYEEEYKVKDQTLVYGYYRRNSSKTNKIIADITNLCLKFYHITKDKFKHFNSRIYKLFNNGMTFTRIYNTLERPKMRQYNATSVIYGAISITSCRPSIHEWMFKIHNWNGYIQIGIDETKYIRKDGGYRGDFHYKCSGGQSKSYNISSTGAKRQWDVLNEIWDKKLRIGTEIKMELDLSSLDNATLSFTMRNGEKYTAFQNIITGEDIIYCMAVYANNPGDTIELVSYSSS